MTEVADMKAETIEVIGSGENASSKVMTSRRKFEYQNAKLEVIKQFKHNKNLKIFGDNSDDVLAQMAAYRISSDKNAL